MHRKRAIVPVDRVVEVDRAFDEGRGEYADTAEIEQVHRCVRPHGVVTEMRIAVDNPVIVERHIPGAEHVVGDSVADLDVLVGEFQQPAAVEPCHGQQPPGRKAGDGFGHMHALLLRMHRPVEFHVAQLAVVIDLFAQPGGDLGLDLARIDRLVIAAVDGEHDAELAEIGFDRRSHIGILELAGERASVEADRAVHLAERSGGGGVAFEVREPFFPAVAELGRHPAADEEPAHRRRIGLQLAELGDVFRRQDVRDGRHQLRDLHQRPLEAAERALEVLGVPLPVHPDAEIALAREPRRDAADRGADAGVAPHASGQPVLLVPARAVARAARRAPHETASSSSIVVSIRDSPFVQNAGSEASSPNGASSSRWCSVPPASSIERYFSGKSGSPASKTA